jgi:hypothetical protein
MTKIRKIRIKKTDLHKIIYGGLSMWENKISKRTTLTFVATPETDFFIDLYIETK